MDRPVPRLGWEDMLAGLPHWEIPFLAIAIFLSLYLACLALTFNGIDRERGAWWTEAIARLLGDDTTDRRQRPLVRIPREVTNGSQDEWVRSGLRATAAKSEAPAPAMLTVVPDGVGTMAEDTGELAAVGADTPVVNGVPHPRAASG